MPSHTKTIYDFIMSDDFKETPKGKSMTLPNESYTIKEILQKFTSGINLPITRNGEFDDNPDLNDSVIDRDPAALS